MSAGLPFANTQQFTTTVSGRTITPTSPLIINDGRQRLPAANGSVTLTATNDVTWFDLYAAQSVNNTYTLLAVAQGTDMTGRRDIIPIGKAIDYPTKNGCTWLPLPGGGMDAYIGTDQYGVHVRPFASGVFNFPYSSLIIDQAPGATTPAVLYFYTNLSAGVIANTVPGYSQPGVTPDLFLTSSGGLVMQGQRTVQLLGSAAMYINYTTSLEIGPFGSNRQRYVWDAHGRMRYVQTPAPGIAAGSGAGASPTVFLTGTDEVGRITVTTGASGTAGSHATVATVTFAWAYDNPPYGVALAPGNTNTEDLASNAVCAAPVSNVRVNGFDIISGQASLATNTQYMWVYRVFPQ